MSETKLQYQQRMQRKFDRQQDQIADLTNENFRLKKQLEKYQNGAVDANSKPA